MSTPTAPSPIAEQTHPGHTVRYRRAITWPLHFAFQEERFFLILSVFIGIFSALAVVCFRLAIEWCRLKMLGPRITPSGLHVILAPTLVGLVVAVLVLGVLTFVNCLGVRAGSTAQNVLMAMKICAIAAIVICGWVFPGQPHPIFAIAPRVILSVNREEQKNAGC